MYRYSASMFDERRLRGVAQQVHSFCGDEGTFHVFYEGLATWGGVFWLLFAAVGKK